MQAQWGSCSSASLQPVTLSTASSVRASTKRQRTAQHMQTGRDGKEAVLSIAAADLACFIFLPAYKTTSQHQPCFWRLRGDYSERFDG